MKIIVPDFLVERLAPEIARIAPGPGTTGIAGDGTLAASPDGAAPHRVHRPHPADSPLCNLPNVFLTPHNPASSPHTDARVIALVLDNLGWLVHGEPLLNVVDKRRGH